MRVVVASTYLPFLEGGGVKIVEDLTRALAVRGFETETVLLPFYPAWPLVPEQTLALRLLDLSRSSGERIDRLIAIRTPAYALRHPNKVAWFIHHHREAYDLWGTPWSGMPDDEHGRRCRDAIRRSDDVYLRECRKVFTNSQVVAGRLKRFNGLEPDGVLYPPLAPDDPFRVGPFGDYLFYPSRITPLKRQELAVEALRYTREDVRLVVGGVADQDAYFDRLRASVRERGLDGRVEFTGWLTEQHKAELLSGCCGVLFVAHQEDYGYVTLEAFESGKPVITLTDSGGILELVEDGVNGLVAEPEPWALAEAMDQLWADRGTGRRMGEAAREAPRRLRIDWDHVVENLTS
jgi:glycosyltransferase involved in cell wall biosynthesis